MNVCCESERAAVKMMAINAQGTKGQTTPAAVTTTTTSSVASSTTTLQSTSKREALRMTEIGLLDCLAFVSSAAVLAFGVKLNAINAQGTKGQTTPAAVTTTTTSSVASSTTTLQSTSSTEPNVIEDIRIECNSNDIRVKIETNARFNGLIYPKGLSRNSTCMSQYDNRIDPDVEYVIPLWSCNTMSSAMPDGGIEYFNTIVVQPHRKLVTSHGRGYHIRCKYQTQEKTVQSDFNVKQLEGTTPIIATAALPACRMLIYFGGENRVAENVRIGDPLTLEIELDPQEIYGFKVSSCWVRDGMNQGEQRLIDEFGCPEDEEIMGPFVYEPNKRVARVQFQAHKFPYTPSVYYTCNIKLCVKGAGGCDDVPPDCGRDYQSVLRRRRRKRQLTRVEEEERKQRTIQVYSGLYVSEEEDYGTGTDVDFPDVEKVEEAGLHEGKFCMRKETFWWIIVICGLLLMFAVLITTLILIQRRRRGKHTSTTGSSIYSGPYSNAAYSHSSS
ncbi:unnamed protein product [Notodromas monacha]|uniref:ZP domain-containing protein n=1 Tax=Notodromas monacha TaxID=399045 RepID=A0A7R9BGX1_9CRUS|nr:unnamed protein product [Notodromas monacha]CAG0915253.1 unnamed protein product [Notodromas monacha]